MSETKDNRTTRQTERTLQTLNNAVIQARKRYKERHGDEFEECYYYSLKDGMTHEEELLEIFHALIRSGVTGQSKRNGAG